MKIRVCTANGHKSSRLWEASDGSPFSIGPEWSDHVVSPLTADVLRIDPDFRVDVLEDDPAKNLEQLQRLVRPA